MGLFKRKDEYPNQNVETPQPVAEPVVEEAAPVIPAGVPVNLTQEQLLSVIRAMGEEMRKPTAEQQAKLDEDARRRQRENEARLQVGKAAQAEREARTKNCNHHMDNGRGEKYSIGQQLCSDGMVHVFCVRCATDIKVFKPTPDQLSVSVA